VTNDGERNVNNVCGSFFIWKTSYMVGSGGRVEEVPRARVRCEPSFENFYSQRCSCIGERELRQWLGIVSVSDGVRLGRLRWFRHV
jgi:hypothetical protein